MYFWRSIGKIIKFIWKSLNVLRDLIANIIILVVILSIISIFGIVNHLNEQHKISQSGVLVLDIEGVISDSMPYNNDYYKLNKILNNNKPDLTRQNSLFELTQKIDQATADSAITGIILKLDNFVNSDLPSLEYLAKYLEKFKASGKPIYAVGSNFDQKQYYLASLANKIYLLNQGSVALYGFAANNFYFKSLLDNLKVNTHVFRIGTYKSAVEPFLRDDMSDAAKENTNRWLSKMWHNYLNDIALHREQDPDNLAPAPNVMLSRLSAVSGSMSEYALENGIIDGVVSADKAEQIFGQAFNLAPEISIYDYELLPNKMSSFTGENTNSESPTPLIGVVFVEGTISMESDNNNVASSETIVEQLKKLAKNKAIRAVVIRINSPGGAVFASEAIRSQIAALRQQDIPVVISMGGMAASGGYWIATQSDYIVANKNTITGSIGIFGVIPTFENSLAEIGIHTDGVSTSPLAGISLSKNLSDEFNQLMQMSIQNGYDNFISLVTESRKMPYNEVEKIAQGQVWLGEEAKKFGLVDKIGDFDDAVAKAASLARLTQYQIDWPKSDSDLLSALVSQYANVLPRTAVELISHQLPISQQLQQHIALWNNLTDPQNRYTYCLTCSDIK